MKTAVFLTVFILFMPFSPFPANGMEFREILDRTIDKESQNNSAVRDAVYAADGLYTELNDEGGREKEVRTRRTVYRKGPDKSYSVYLYMYIDGKKLTDAEIKKETAKMRRGDRDKKDSKRSFLSPFSPEVRGDYDFFYAGPAEWSGRLSWIIEFKPKVPDETRAVGRAWVSRTDFNVFCLEFSMSKLPWMLKDFNMKVIYGDFEGCRLPAELEMNMQVKVKFLLTLADKRLKFKEIYSGYRINSGIRDSFFLGKVLD